MAKIATIQPLGTWDFNGETMHSFSVSLDNGLQGKINAKSPDRWSAGDEVEASQYQDKQGNNCLKLSKPNSGGNFKGGGKKMDATTEKRITFLSCLSSAASLANGSGANAEQVIELATKFMEAAYKASETKPTQQGPQTNAPANQFAAQSNDLPF